MLNMQEYFINRISLGKLYQCIWSEKKRNAVYDFEFKIYLIQIVI